jgi:hypothetical protein
MFSKKVFWHLNKYGMTQDENEFADWLKSRPACIQALAEEFPPGTQLDIENVGLRFVIGWNESGWLIVAKTYDPSAKREYLFADHARGKTCHCCGKELKPK